MAESGDEEGDEGEWESEEYDDEEEEGSDNQEEVWVSCVPQTWFEGNVGA